MSATMERPKTAPRPIQLPDHERGLGADDLRRLDRLNAALARRDLSTKQREAAMRERTQMERAKLASREAEAVQAGIAETAGLAEARGEAVETLASGALRVDNRDPLASLMRAGVLSDRQLEVALAVQELYELRQIDTAPAPFDGMPSGVHDHEQFLAIRFLRAKALVPASQLEIAVLVGHFRTLKGVLVVLKGWPERKAAGMETNLALSVLRKICGERHTLTSLGRGRAYERNRQAFLDALSIAEEVLNQPRRS